MRTLLVVLGTLFLSLSMKAQLTSVKSGNWSDPTVWSGGRIPAATDKVTIAVGTSVTYDASSATIAGAEVLGTLIFSPSKTTELQSNKNIVIRGKLEMRPGSWAVKQLIRFIGINESLFVGGGMDVLESDIGLWVMGDGQLDLVGTSRNKGWANLTMAAVKTATNVTLRTDAPWTAGDEIVITPTESSTSSTFTTSFEERKINSKTSATIALDRGLTYDHPAVANRWTAEILNLTRNVQIEGTASGRAHIFIMSMKPQTVQWVAIRYVGPRKLRDADLVTDMIPGRYGLHFHHSMDGSRGSVVEGNVIRDAGNHAYVPHVSHGITFKGNIAYNTTESAFWWDPGTKSHDIVYDGNIAALTKYVFQAKGLTLTSNPVFGSSGFFLGMGDGNIARNNVTVGQQNQRTDLAGAYEWEADNEGIWIFENNLAHNGGTGLRVWQNTTLPHVIKNFDSYNNRCGIFHGAYVNCFRYVGGYIYGNALELRASAFKEYNIRFEEMTFDGGGIVDYPIRLANSVLAGTRPVLFRGIKVMNYKRAAISYEMPTGSRVKPTDFVLCDLGVTPIQFVKPMITGDKIRFQPASGTPFQYIGGVKSNIAAFAPTVWGQGNGLKTEWFYKPDLTSLAFTSIEPVIYNLVWKELLNYRFTDRVRYSIRWSGKIMPQFSEPVTFYLTAGGGYRLWINDQLVLNSWIEHYPLEFKSAPISLQAGVKYNFRLEYFNQETDLSRTSLMWSSAKLPKEIIPESQFFADPIPITTSMAMMSTQDAMMHSMHTAKSPTAAKFSVFPVPSKGSVTVTGLEEEYTNGTVEVISSTGARVHREQINQPSNFTLNLQHLSNGSYLLLFRARGKSRTEKLVISR